MQVHSSKFTLLHRGRLSFQQGYSNLISYFANYIWCINYKRKHILTCIRSALCSVHAAHRNRARNVLEKYERHKESISKFAHGGVARCKVFGNNLISSTWATTGSAKYTSTKRWGRKRLRRNMPETVLILFNSFPLYIPPLQQVMAVCQPRDNAPPPE